MQRSVSGPAQTVSYVTREKRTNRWACFFMDYYGEEALPPGNDSSQGDCDRNVSLQFLQPPVSGRIASRKFLQPPVGGRIASRKHLQTREGNGNSSENAFPIILCGQTPTRNKFPRLPLMHTYDKKHHTQTDGGLGLPVADGRHVPPGAASTPTESAVCRL